MKQFLVPALLLGLVGVVAAFGAGSVPAASAVAARECHMPAMKVHGSCPMTSIECDKIMDAGTCPDAAGEHCAVPADKADCVKNCEDKQELDCCKKKMECGDCPKTPHAPIEKP